MLNQTPIWCTKREFALAVADGQFLDDSHLIPSHTHHWRTPVRVYTMADRHEIQEHPMVSVPDALRTILQVVSEARQLQTTTTSETIPLAQALGRILAEDVIMPPPGYPPYKASIMDGYAISSSHKAVRQFRILNKVFAGDGIQSNVDNAQNETKITATADSTINTLPTAVYITTGAKVPDQYDVVVPVELCEVKRFDEQQQQQSILTIDLEQAKIQPNQWIRPAGCDLAPNSTVIAANKEIDYIDIGLMRQAACATVRVYKTTTVGVLSTGNELIKQDWTMELGRQGAIPDVNRPCLLGLLQSWSDVCTAIDLGTCRDDDPDALVRCMSEAVEKCDVILTTGGISMGETDVMEETLVQKCRGKLHFGRLNMKPGKPTTFITLPRRRSDSLQTDRSSKNSDGVCHVFALPGNPVSAVVCSHLLVKPCLDLLHSMKSSPSPVKLSHATTHMEVQATLQQTLKLDFERPEYHRVRLDSRHGQYFATSTGTQRSSRLASLQNADGLMVLPQATKDKKQAIEGEEYTVLLLRPLFGVEPSTVATSRHLQRAVQLALLIVDTSAKIDPQILGQEAKSALSGSKTDSVRVTLTEQFTSTDALLELSTSLQDDIVMIVTVPGPGMFNHHSSLAQSLRESPDFRDAPAIAQQIRQGASTAGDASAAIWETVVGYANDHLVILMSSVGLKGGLSHVRGLLKHALQTARGEPHQHH